MHGQALVGVRIAQPFSTDPLHRAVRLHLGLCGGDSRDQRWLFQRHRDRDVLDEIPRCTTSTPVYQLDQLGEYRERAS